MFTIKALPDRFLPLAADPDPDVVFNVLSLKHSTLWESHGQRVRGLLHSPDRRFRAIALWILGEAPPRTNLTLVAPFIDDADEDLATTAEFFLRLTPKDATDLVKPARGRSLKLRKTAIRSLGWESNPDRDALLVSLLADSEPTIRVQAFDILVSSFDESAKHIEVVTRMLDDPSPSVRATVLYKAVNLKLPNLFARVKAGLTHESRELRQAALWSAGSVDPNGDLTEDMVQAVEMGVDANYFGSPAFDDPRFAHLVQKCLKSKVADVRQLLSFHYGSETAKKDVAVMIQLARDPDPGVASVVIPALGRLGDDRAFNALLELLEAKDESVRKAAISGLAATGKFIALQTLEKYTKDNSRAIRTAAKYAIAELKDKVIPPR